MSSAAILRASAICFRMLGLCDMECEWNPCCSHCVFCHMQVSFDTVIGLLSGYWGYATWNESGILSAHLVANIIVGILQF